MTASFLSAFRRLTDWALKVRSALLRPASITVVQLDGDEVARRLEARVNTGNLNCRLPFKEGLT